MTRASCSAGPLLYLATVAAVLSLMLQPAVAQFPSRGGGERGGSEGGRGFGGRPGDSEGGRSFGGRGGESRGGESRGGSSRGGDSGRGGFDPSSFLDRLDRNGNGMLDMDEREGPAAFMISRLQREDPSIRVDRPIPMSKLREGFERMRGGGDRGGDSGGDRSRGGDSGGDNGLTVDVLVPGFGVEVIVTPVPGFGPTAELFDVELRPEDLQEAEERLRRYDRNRDGFLSKEELGSRWEGDPMDFDRNRDGKLTASELAVRYARRRSVEQQNRDTRRRDEGRRRSADDQRPSEPVDPYGGRKSFRMLPPSAVEGLPEWFASSDADGDGQVMMNEYTQDWSNDKVEEFFAFDLNRDGTITARECLAAVKDGAARSGGGSGGEATASSTAGPSDRPAAPAAAGGGASGPIDKKLMDYSARILERNDTNKDGALTVDEWKQMFMDVSPADANGDGRITLDEYAGWMQSRAKR